MTILLETLITTRLTVEYSNSTIRNGVTSQIRNVLMTYGVRGEIITWLLADRAVN